MKKKTFLSIFFKPKEAGKGRGKPKAPEVSKKSSEEKYADDIRNLHEAYQVRINVGLCFGYHLFNVIKLTRFQISVFK
jgi:hypothetical protein